MVTPLHLARGSGKITVKPAVGLGTFIGRRHAWGSKVYADGLGGVCAAGVGVVGSNGGAGEPGTLLLP